MKCTGLSVGWRWRTRSVGSPGFGTCCLRSGFAGSSEMFGRAEETPQTEATRFHSRSSYGISKVAGFELTRNYREAYGLHASSGILFNHESPPRGYEFVTRKITSTVAAIRAGRARKLAAAREYWRRCG